MVDLHDYDIQCIEHEILWKYDKSPCDYSECDCLLSLRKDMINKRALVHQKEMAKENDIRIIGVSQLIRIRIDGSEKALPDDCLSYLDREFLTKRIKVLHRESYYSNDSNNEDLEPVSIIEYVFDSSYTTRLAAYIAGMTSGNYAFIYKIDDSLEKELRINVVFYEYEKEQEKTEG